ncbi:unnamed protein product [Lampetra fluviatilis]
MNSTPLRSPCTPPPPSAPPFAQEPSKDCRRKPRAPGLDADTRLPSAGGRGDETLSLGAEIRGGSGSPPAMTSERAVEMGTCRLPSPAELDAYARKVADRPLTVKIFSGNVKVPQRKVTRRRVNGLEVPSASASAQRYSPYPAPGSRYQGLLALVTAVPQASAPKSSSSHGRRVRDMSLPGAGNVPSSGFTMPTSGAGGVGGRDKASADARTREAAAASLALPCAGRHPAAVVGGSLQSGAVQTLHNNAFPKMDAKEVAAIRVPRPVAAPPAVASHAASALCEGGLPGAYAGKSSTVSYNPGGHFAKPPEASGSGGLKAIHLPPLCQSALPTHVLPFPHLGAGGQAAVGAGMAYDAQKPRAVFYSAYGAVGGGKPFDPALMPPNVTISALPRNTPHPFYANLPSIDAVVKQITAQSLAQASQQGETSVCQIDDMRLKGHDQQKGGRPGAVDCLGGPLGSLMGPELGSGDPSSRGGAPQFGTTSDAQGDESIVERLLSFSTEMGNVPAGVGFHFPSPHWHGGMPPLPAAPSSAQGYQQQTGGSGFPPPPSSVPQSVGMSNGFMSAHGGGNQPGPSRGAAVGSAFHHHNHGHHHHHHHAGHSCGGTMVQQQQQQHQQQQQQQQLHTNSVGPLGQSCRDVNAQPSTSLPLALSLGHGPAQLTDAGLGAASAQGFLHPSHHHHHVRHSFMPPSSVGSKVASSAAQGHHNHQHHHRQLHHCPGSAAGSSVALHAHSLASQNALSLHPAAQMSHPSLGMPGQVSHLSLPTCTGMPMPTTYGGPGLPSSAQGVAGRGKAGGPTGRDGLPSGMHVGGLSGPERMEHMGVPTQSLSESYGGWPGPS